VFGIIVCDISTGDALALPGQLGNPQVNVSQRGGEFF
jgi:hypothetical protein